MTQYGFYFDTSRCTGCKTCQLACIDFHDLTGRLTYRRIYDYEGGSWEQDVHGAWHQDAFMYHVSLSCNHCNLAVCVYVCPTGAMHKEENGIVRVDQTVCIGCGYCTMACPYGAPHISEVTHTSAKCDGCYARLEEQKKPICVEACPLRALEFDDITVLRNTYGSLAAIAPLPDEHYTLPNLVIHPAPAAREPGTTEGFIANPEEVRP
ncbi:MAG: dimethylsulfoxide reductase subunit B, partial [Coriobacteriales bacterium]|nr:dimethylsulfoxide reductase subunit B [Coriobacteriales bacterium]